MEQIFQVKNPRTDLPHISRHVKVGVDKFFGRFLFTTEKLSPGDVIAVEEPFFKSLDLSETSKRCTNCLRRLPYENYYACLNCNAAVTFCSQLCKDKADELFHNAECHFLTKIDKDDGYFLLMMRMLIKSINIAAAGSVEKFQLFVEGRDKNATIFDVCNNSELGMLESCLNLESGNFPEDIKFVKCFIEGDATIKKFYCNESQKFFLVKIIVKIMGILNRNSFCIDFDDDGGGGGGSCGAVFTFASLFNHSCSPNIDRVNVGSKMAFVCSRPIEKNQQLFICYR